MKDFADFMKDLQTIMILIQKEAQSVFLPICLSHSPINPTKDFIVVFRDHKHVQSFSLDGWFTENIPQLAKKFSFKTVKLALPAGQASINLRMQLDSDLRKWY